MTKFLWGSLIIALAAVMPFQVIAEDFDWKQFEGTTIVANFPPNLAYDTIGELVPEFTELTGIKVEIDRINYMKLHDKQILEMSKPTGDYDVVSLVCMWKTEYVAGDMLTELEPMFADPKLAVPDFDFDDLIPAFVDNTGRVGGDKIYMGGPGSKLYALPFSAETSILAYRKDLFEQYDLKVPETYDEVREISKFFYENVDGVYGLTMRGASGHQATAGWLTHANPYGAKVFDENWEPIFDSPESIEALYFLKDVVKYGPPGIPGFDVSAADNSFLLGQAAMQIDHDKIAGLSNDPKQSKVVGKVGFARHPGQKIHSTETGGFGIGIPTNARSKGAAFLFIQWITSKEMSQIVAERGGMSNRISIYADPDMQARFPEFKVILDQINNGDVDPDWRPIIPEWGEINVQLLGVAINQVLTGDKTPEEAMAGIKEPVREIMKRAGYYDK
ncbi:MAG: extracellular solute-binding protein [bacterium]|nr:extracellular solute-binding protein [bacterium]